MTDEFSNLSDDELDLMTIDVINYFHEMKAATGLDIVRSSQFFSYDEYLKFGFYLDSRDAVSILIPIISSYRLLPSRQFQFASSVPYTAR